LTIESAVITIPTPASVTVKTCPPTVTVPVLASPGFAPTEIPTTPGPDPEAAVTMVIQGAVVAAVQAHPPDVATLNAAVPPADENAVAVGDKTNEQVKLACATVNVWPATVMVVLRASPALGSSANVTSPGPETDMPVRIRTHEAPAEAVHAQPALVFTVNDPLPPEEGYDPPAGARV
jgi:hypothetical protein